MRYRKVVVDLIVKGIQIAVERTYGLLVKVRWFDGKSSSNYMLHSMDKW